MKTNNIFFKVFIYFVFTTLLIAEYGLPFLGVEKGISIALILFLFLVKSNVISSIFVAFIYAFTVDSIFLITPFGVFCLLYILYFLIIKYLNNKAFVELILLIINVVNYIVVAVLFTGLSFWHIISSILFYMLMRLIFLLVFKV